MQKLISDLPLFNSHQNNLEESYLQFLEELREDISEGHDSEILSEDFQEEFKTIIFSDDLNDYHPLKFYWLNLIDKLVETIGLFEEEEISSTEEIIGAFSDSDLLGFIVEQLEANVDIETLIDQIFEIQEIQIVSFYHLHISKDEWVPTGPVSYQFVSEIGEDQGHIFLGPDKTHFFIPEFSKESFIPVCGYFPEAEEIQVSVGKEVKTYKSSDFPMSKSGNLFVFPGLEEEKFKTKHFEKVSWASEIIQKTSAPLYSVLKKYTSAVVPLYQEEIVSFSMQVLPTYSCINMENRDRIDLIDDLLHENGHHFLNSILEGEEEVIFEDDEKIYYSPWRQSLRPIRGIYHGMITFYWAYRLFKELSLCEQKNELFTKEEIEKIHFRFLEESVLLTGCFQECKRGHTQGKLTSFGFEISLKVIEEIEADKELETTIFNALNDESQAKLKKVKDELSEGLKASPASH